MEEMVEPDRTIMIVSIIGLVVIWGSFFYHRLVQGGAGPGGQAAAEQGSTEGSADAAVGPGAGGGASVRQRPRKKKR